MPRSWVGERSVRLLRLLSSLQLLAIDCSSSSSPPNGPHTVALSSMVKGGGGALLRLQLPRDPVLSSLFRTVWAVFAGSWGV